MPRSSGGGSHSGGYHSSSSSSSSRSSGGSHSGGYHSSSSSYRSSGGSHSGGYHSSSYRSSGSCHSSYSSSYRKKPSLSKTAFRGATKYVYYRDHQPHYIYSDYTSVRRKVRKGVLWGWGIFIALMIMGFVDLFTPQTRLSTDYDHTMLVQDGAGVLGEDTQALQEAMNAFFEETGIAPSVITVTDADWQSHYKSLDVYALDLYANAFRDERHWLIVYSAATADASGFEDWKWEGIQGDDTLQILTSAVIDQFGNTLTKNLMAAARCTVSDALAASFNTLTPTVMKAEADGESYSIVTACAIILVFILIALWHGGVLQKGARRPGLLPRDAVVAPAGSREITCGYCDGVYLNDKVKCPYCGAPRGAAK